MADDSPWDLKRLRDDVRSVYGSDRCQIVERSLTSMDQRLEFARYHYQEQKRILSQFASPEASPIHHVILALGGRGEEGHQFRKALKHAMAHVVACVSSMHAVADTLSFAIYHILAMDLDPQSQLTERQINVHSVAKRASDLAVRQLLIELTENDGFRYLNALANHSKHRAIVGVGYRAETESEPEGQNHGLSFTAFEHDGLTHEAKWVSTTLNAEYDRQQPLIQAIGRALNAAISARRV